MIALLSGLRPLPIPAVSGAAPLATLANDSAERVFHRSDTSKTVR